MSPQNKQFTEASRWNLVLVAGILFALACPPYGQAWTAWLVPGILLVNTRSFSTVRAALAGLLYGLVIGVTVGNWVPDVAAATLGISTTTARPLVYLFFLLNPGIPCALLLVAYAAACRRVRGADRPIIGAFLWVASEWLRSTAFGWELLAHTQYQSTWLIQIADLGGAYLVSFIVAFVSISVAELVAERAWEAVSLPKLPLRLALPASALLVTFMYGAGAASVYGPLPSASPAAYSYEQQNAKLLPVAYGGAGEVMPELRLREVSTVAPSGAGEMTVSPILCLDLLDGGLMRNLVRDGAEVLINNCRVDWMDANFNAAPAQHLAMAVLRAVETRRFVVRASGDQDSRMISPFGLTYEQPPSGTQLTLREGMTRYTSLGDSWILMGLGFCLVTTLRGRKNEPNQA